VRTYSTRISLQLGQWLWGLVSRVGNAFLGKMGYPGAEAAPFGGGNNIGGSRGGLFRRTAWPQKISV